MNHIDKLDYMIKSLQVAKDEAEYAEEYFNNIHNLNDKDSWRYTCNHRRPNGSILKDSLRMVGRLSFQLANEVTLSTYNDEVFEDGE